MDGVEDGQMRGSLVSFSFSTSWALWVSGCCEMDHKSADVVRREGRDAVFGGLGDKCVVLRAEAATRE